MRSTGRGQPIRDGVAPGAGEGPQGRQMALQPWYPVLGLSGGVDLRTELGHDGEDCCPSTEGQEGGGGSVGLCEKGRRGGSYPGAPGVMGTPESGPLLSPPLPHHPLGHSRPPGPGKVVKPWPIGEVAWPRSSWPSETPPSAPSPLSVPAPRRVPAFDTGCSLPRPLGRKRAS